MMACSGVKDNGVAGACAGRSCPFQVVFACFGPWLPAPDSALPQRRHPPAQRRRKIREASPLSTRLRAPAAGRASLIPDGPTVLAHLAGICRSSRCSWGSLRGRRRRATTSPEIASHQNDSRTWAARAGITTIFRDVGPTFRLATILPRLSDCLGAWELFHRAVRAFDSGPVGWVSVFRDDDEAAADLA